MEGEPLRLTVSCAPPAGVFFTVKAPLDGDLAAASALAHGREGSDGSGEIRIQGDGHAGRLHVPGQARGPGQGAMAVSNLIQF